MCVPVCATLNRHYIILSLTQSVREEPRVHCSELKHGSNMAYQTGDVKGGDMNESFALTGSQTLHMFLPYTATMNNSSPGTLVAEGQ